MLAVADGGEQRLLVRCDRSLTSCAKRPSLRSLAEVEVIAAEVALEDLAADGDAARALLVLDPVADLLLGAAGLDEVQPVLARRLVRGGDDLHRVAAAQPVAQRHQAAVDARARRSGGRPRSGCGRRSR